MFNPMWMKQGFLWKNEDEIYSGLKGEIPEKNVSYNLSMDSFTKIYNAGQKAWLLAAFYPGVTLFGRHRILILKSFDPKYESWIFLIDPTKWGKKNL